MIPDAAIVDKMRVLYPLLTTTAAPDAWALAWLPWARAFVSPEVFTFVPAYPGGPDYTLAVALVLAHGAYSEDPAGVLGTGGAGAPGPIASVSTSRRSVSYAVSASSGTPGDDAWWASTAPGRRWLQIRDSRAAVRAPMYFDPGCY